MDDAITSQMPRTADPFLCGVTGIEQLALGYPMVSGLFFPDLEGPVVLLRRQLYPGQVSDWYIAGTADPAALIVGNGPELPHGAGTGWEYRAARAFGNGFVGEFSTPVRIDFDEEGAMCDPGLPTWPRNVAAEPTADGKFLVRWTYSPIGEGAAPTDFEIYEGEDAESIDYESPIGTEAYDRALYEYTFLTGAYGDGTPHAFAVRARNVDEVAERNEYATAVVIAEAATPAAAEIASAIGARLGGVM
jgi:hypothetical protein